MWNCRTSPLSPYPANSSWPERPNPPSGSPISYRTLNSIARRASLRSTGSRWGTVVLTIFAISACSGSDGSGARSSATRQPAIDRAARTQPGRSTSSPDPKCAADPAPLSRGRAQPLSLQLLWDAPVGVNRFSSPTVADLDGDGALDVVVAGGVQNKTGSVTAIAGATGDISSQIRRQAFSVGL